MSKYIQAFIAGIKENLSFKGVFILHIINPLIFILIISTIWSSLLNENYMDYFVALFLLIPNFQYYSSISSEFNQSIRKGWDLSFGKPASPFLIKSFYIAGKHFLPYVFNFVVGFTYFVFISNAKVNFLVAILSIPFITLIDFSIAYFISLFSHYFYSVWGIRVFVRVFDTIFGGNAFPLYLLQNGNFLFFLPFANKAFFIADAILKGYIPINAYLSLILWSLVLFAISYAFHKKGWKKFEGQGG